MSEKSQKELPRLGSLRKSCHVSEVSERAVMAKKSQKELPCLRNGCHAFEASERAVMSQKSPKELPCLQNRCHISESAAMSQKQLSCLRGTARFQKSQKELPCITKSCYVSEELPCLRNLRKSCHVSIRAAMSEAKFVEQRYSVMTPWRGSTRRITGHLWGETTGHRWISLTKCQQTRSFDMLFVDGLKKAVGQTADFQSSCRLFKTPWCNVIVAWLQLSEILTQYFYLRERITIINANDVSTVSARLECTAVLHFAVDMMFNVS